MIKSLLLLALLNVSFADDINQACQVDLPDRILFLEKPKTLNQVKHLLESSTCSKEENWNVLSNLYSVNGKINTKNYNRSFKQSHSRMIVFKKNNVQIIDLAQYLKDRLDIAPNISIRNIKANNIVKAIGQNDNTSIQIGCNNCDNTGEKHISLTAYNPIENTSKNHWITADFLQKITVLKAKYSLTPYIQGSINDKFTKSEAFVVTPELYAGIKTVNLHHFKLSRKIDKDQPLKQSDLVPRDLVTLGKTVDVKIKSKNLTISTKAVARGNGKFGSTVNLYNEKSKKTYTGTVIDENLVEVKL